ncbi:MAG TPA: PIG-L family deacetylase [Thermoanaerobaculia bacterium]
MNRFPTSFLSLGRAVAAALRHLTLGAVALLALSAGPLQAQGLEGSDAVPFASLRAIPAGNLLWIGAHPDDEVILAPLLGELCIEGRHSCTLLVLTRGESGLCRLPGGCAPDVATVRTAEMQAAAALYRARLVQGTLPDVPGPDPVAVRRAWAATVGGKDALLDRLAGAIRIAAPRAIITFDPRHGSTCHPAHRAVGTLVLQALARLAAPPPVFVLQSRVRIAPGGANIALSPAVEGPELLTFDATKSRRGAPGTLWDYLLADAHRQPSQFDATFLASMEAVPTSARRVWLLPAAAWTPSLSGVDGCE